MEEMTRTQKEALRRWLQAFCVTCLEARLRQPPGLRFSRRGRCFLGAVSAWEQLLFDRALKAQQGRPN